MSRRFLRNASRARTVNVALAATLGLWGCGEARPSLAVGEVEQEINGTVGTLHALIVTYDDHSETIYRLLTDDGEDIGLYFGNAGTRVRVGERIAVRGERKGNSIDVTGHDLIQRRVGDTQERRLTGAHTARNFKVAAISLDTSLSKATFGKRVFDDADSPTAFYRENSYGDWVFTGDSYGPYTIATTSCADSNLYTIASQAAAAAKADGFDPANYDNVMYYVPANFNCSWGGVAEVGTNEVRGFWNAKHSWYRGTGCVVLAQELGHNYGLLHSHKCTAPPYVNSASYGGTSCSGYSEYGDTYTPMGGGCGHFNSPEMGAMRFVTGCNTLDVTSSGTFEIGPLEKRCDGPQIIRVPSGKMANRGPQYIYVEYRAGKGTIGSDNSSPKGLHFYASAEYGGNATGIMADNHDLDYAVDPFSIHAPVTTAGSSWTEPDSMATFTLMAIGQTATVQVTIAGGGGGAPQCVGGGTPPAAPVCGIDGGERAGRADPAAPMAESSMPRRTAKEALQVLGEPAVRRVLLAQAVLLERAALQVERAVPAVRAVAARPVKAARAPAVQLARAPEEARAARPVRERAARLVRERAARPVRERVARLEAAPRERARREQAARAWAAREEARAARAAVRFPPPMTVAAAVSRVDTDRHAPPRCSSDSLH